MGEEREEKGGEKVKKKKNLLPEVLISTDQLEPGARKPSRSVTGRKRRGGEGERKEKKRRRAVLPSRKYITLNLASALNQRKINRKRKRRECLRTILISPFYLSPSNGA